MEIQQLIRIVSDATKEQISEEDRKRAAVIVSWQRDMRAIANSKSIPWKRSVLSMMKFLTDAMDEPNNVSARIYASQMLTQLPKEWIVFDTIDSWLKTINFLITRAPEYSPVKTTRVFFPLSKIFVFFMTTTSGSVLFRMEEFNRRMKSILDEWCSYLDSKESRQVLNPDLQINPSSGWLSPSSQSEFCLEQCLNYEYRNNSRFPYWKFKSFNHFFNRQMNLEKYRPLGVELDADGEDLAITSANDGTVYRISENVAYNGKFWMKGQEFSLFDMMGGGVDIDGRRTPAFSIDKFIGGSVMQSFLSGSDYHRWHAPMTGKVIEARRINGMTFSSLLTEGLDLGAGVLSQGYAAMVNTRGLIIIENSKLGQVAVIPIGITEISSINITVSKGQKVQKGDELGYFSYGGSSLALVFQKGMIEKFSVTESSSEFLANSAVLNRMESESKCKNSSTCEGNLGCLMVRATIAIARKQKCGESGKYSKTSKKRRIEKYV